jgi:hypothetical protein
MLIVIAAIAAFASTGNAGILSASRYPLAMAATGSSRRASPARPVPHADPAIVVTAACS